MTHEKHNHPHSHEHHKETQSGPYWKRAHHDWKFWVAVSLMLTAMLVYIVTFDEAIQPDTQTRDQIKQPLP
jgi:hypothetical protein